MNCKPGDLARVKDNAKHIDANGGPECPGIAGAFTTILQPNVDLSVLMLRLTWNIDTVVCRKCGQAVEHGTDESLMPIRDPGDDAVDQMVAKVGKAPIVNIPVIPSPFERYKEQLK